MSGRAKTLASRLLGVVLAGLITCSATGMASAQGLLEPPKRRQGYYFTVGYHLALNKNWEDKEDWGVWSGTELVIRVGQLLTKRFGMGLQIHSGQTTGQGEQAALLGLGLEANWELVRNLAVYGGAGVDTVSISTVNVSGGDLRGTAGSGYVLGLTYDWFFGPRTSGGFALSPNIQARLVPGTITWAMIGLVGIQISYYTGLPRHQLELPVGEAFRRE